MTRRLIQLREDISMQYRALEEMKQMAATYGFDISKDTLGVLLGNPPEKEYVDMIEKDMQPFRQAILDARTDIEMYGALKSFVLFLKDGLRHYYQINICVGKYFDEYICKSAEAIKRKNEFEKLEKKLTGQE